MISTTTLMIWTGILLVLSVLVARWRLGVWDIESEDGPPSPSIWIYLSVLSGLVLVCWGAYRMVMEY